MESEMLLFTFAKGLIYLITLFLVLYAIVLGYHWFSYGSSRKTSLTALFIFITGSATLLLGLIISYNFF